MLKVRALVYHSLLSKPKRPNCKSNRLLPWLSYHHPLLTCLRPDSHQGLPTDDPSVRLVNRPETTIGVHHDVTETMGAIDNITIMIDMTDAVIIITTAVAGNVVAGTTVADPILATSVHQLHLTTAVTNLGVPFLQWALLLAIIVVTMVIVDIKDDTRMVVMERTTDIAAIITIRGTITGVAAGARPPHDDGIIIMMMAKKIINDPEGEDLILLHQRAVTAAVAALVIVAAALRLLVTGREEEPGRRGDR
jgi:hypothetical protein